MPGRAGASMKEDRVKGLLFFFERRATCSAGILTREQRLSARFQPLRISSPIIGPAIKTKKTTPSTQSSHFFPG